VLKLKDEFETTKLPSSIAERYRLCDGPTIKVAIFLLCGNECSIEGIVRELSIPEETARRAVDFWKSAGLLTEKTLDSKTEKVIEKNKSDTNEIPTQRPKKLSEELMGELMRNDPDVTILMQESQSCLGRTLSVSETEKLIAIYEYEELPIEVILLALAYSKPKVPTNTVVNYTEKVVRNWHKDGIVTTERAEKYLSMLDSRDRNYAKIAKLTESSVSDFKYRDRKFIDRWFEDFGFGTDVIEQAYLRSDDKGIPYMHAILKDWHAKGFNNVADTRTEISNAQPKVRKKRKSEKDDLMERVLNEMGDEE